MRGARTLPIDRHQRVHRGEDAGSRLENLKGTGSPTTPIGALYQRNPKKVKCEQVHTSRGADRSIVRALTLSFYPRRGDQ